MIFLGNLTTITTDKQSIGFVHYKPFDPIMGMGETEEQLKSEGALLDSIPSIDQTQINSGKSATMFYNPTKGEAFYEYYDVPKTQEQITQDRLTAVEIAIANMMGV